MLFTAFSSFSCFCTIGAIHSSYPEQRSFSCHLTSVKSISDSSFFLSPYLCAIQLCLLPALCNFLISSISELVSSFNLSTIADLIAKCYMIREKEQDSTT